MKALFNLIDGLNLIDSHAQLRLSVVDGYLNIEERSFKVFRPVTDATYRIPLANIITTTATTEKELAEVNKSAIGRGVAGGLLFGPAGLVLGGLSGIGTKKSLKQSHLFIVSYLASDGELKNLTLITPKVSNAGITKKFNKYVSKHLADTRPSVKVAELRALHSDESSTGKIEQYL